jgi:hypothetical protein
MEWNQNQDSDARRLADANLPDRFWGAVAAIVDGSLDLRDGGKFTVEGYELSVGRSYIVISRDQRRIASLGMFTLRRALTFHREKIHAAEAARKAEADAACITWDD